MSNNTITKFIGDISFNNGENDVLVSDLTTVNEVNEALSELKSQLDNTYATNSSLSSYYNKTEADNKYALKGTSYTKSESDAAYINKNSAVIEGNLAIENGVLQVKSNSTGCNAISFLNPSLTDGQVFGLAIGKTESSAGCMYMYYVEPGKCAFCMPYNPGIIIFTTNDIQLNKPTTINGNLTITGEIKQNNDPVITKEQFNTYGMCYSTTFSKYNKPIGASTISTSGFTLKLNDDNTAIVFTNNTKKLTRDVVVLRVYDSSGSMHTLWIDYVNRIVKSDDVSSDIPLDTLIRGEISIPIGFTTTRTILEGQTTYYTYQVRSEEVGDKLNALIRSSS